jgi:hypothetical protein
MSIVNSDAEQYLRLKQRQNALEQELIHIKKIIKPYEDKITNYLLEKNKIIQVNQKVKIRAEQSTPYEPLSFKYLENSFEKVIHNPNQRKQLIQFLKDNRARNLKTKLILDIL